MSLLEDTRNSEPKIIAEKHIVLKTEKKKFIFSFLF